MRVEPVFVLAAETAADIGGSWFLGASIFALTIVLIVALFRAEKAKRTRQQGGAGQALMQMQQQLQQQQRELSPAEASRRQAWEELGQQKVKREIELLELQIQSVKAGLSHRHDQLDVHDIMMEKTKLEIENLQLHLRKMRRELDELGG